VPRAHSVGGGSPYDRHVSEITVEQLLEVAESRDDVLAVYVFGSRGRNLMVDDKSDRDVAVVLADADARERWDHEYPYVHGARVAIASETLDDLRGNVSEHSRYAAAHAQVVLDKTGGEITAIVAQAENLPDGLRDAVVAEALDEYINFTYRALRYGTRIDPLSHYRRRCERSSPSRDACAFTTKNLEWELHNHPLKDWGAGELLRLIDRLIAGTRRLGRRCSNGSRRPLDWPGLTRSSIRGSPISTGSAATRSIDLTSDRVRPEAVAAGGRRARLAAPYEAAREPLSDPGGQDDPALVATPCCGACGHTRRS
jgi:Polymerase beta, Nucleotidyltransferase